MQLVTDLRFSKKDADPLRRFCSWATGPCALDSIPREILAGEFVEFFGIPCPPVLEDILKVAKTCGIRVEESSIPTRGYWHKAKGKLEVFYRQKDSEFRRMFTLLHEIREIIQSICLETDLELRPNCPEWEAEKFASAVITGAGLTELSRYRMVFVRPKGESWWDTLLLWMWADTFRSPLFSERRGYIWRQLLQNQAEASNEAMTSESLKGKGE